MFYKEKIIRNSRFKKIIYLSHPFQGKKENLEDVETKAKQYMKKFPTYLFISPLHAFSFCYDAVPYDKGLDYTLYLLSQSDEMWIISDEYRQSRGCLEEIKFCEENKIPYKIIGKVGE